MIVVDTNVLAYLLIPGKHTDAAEALLSLDAHWVAPRLWRSELRNVLATYVRNDLLDLSDATALFARASALIGSEEYEAETQDVLRLSKESGCSGYDCEFVAIAEFLDVKLVTADTKLANAFPGRTKLLSSVA